MLCCIRSVLENRHLDTSVLQHWQDLLLSATDTSAGAVSFALLWNDLFAPLASQLQLSDHFRAVLHAISSAHPDLGVEPLSIQDSLEITVSLYTCPGTCLLNLSADERVWASIRIFSIAVYTCT